MTGKLACPACGHDLSKVVDIRPFAKREGVFRRRECLACQQRFTTEEQVKPVYRSGAKRLIAFALPHLVLPPSTST